MTDCNLQLGTRTFTAIALLLAMLAACVQLAAAPAAPAHAPARAPAPLNILLFTADDLGADAEGVNCLGGEVPDLTPNIDRFASRGMRFRRAHVTSGICVPSRGAIATGRYGFDSGVYGFFKARPGVPLLMELLREHGYANGILGKVDHSTPHADFRWDYAREQAELGAGRSPARYRQSSREFFAQCREAGKPFYFMVNSHDPHRPFHNPDNIVQGAENPSRLYDPQKIVVPSYLPDLPGVRRELSHYYNSVRRLDDTFGQVIEALREAGLEERTAIVFLSDNGAAVPFAKANCYLASTHTPLIVAWPGLTQAGAVDAEHFVTGIDLLPTFLEGLGLPVPAEVQGRSLLPLLRGEPQPGRDLAFTHIDYKNNPRNVTPMRGIQDGRFGYIFNPWSNGTMRYTNANEGRTMKAMDTAAKNDPAVAARVQTYRDRTVEEFYDLERDPGCVYNLVDQPRHRTLVAEYRKKLRAQMVQRGDPMLATFDARDDPAQMNVELERCYSVDLPVRK